MCVISRFLSDPSYDSTTRQCHCHHGYLITTALPYSHSTPIQRSSSRSNIHYTVVEPSYVVVLVTFSRKMVMFKHYCRSDRGRRQHLYTEHTLSCFVPFLSIFSGALDALRRRRREGNARHHTSSSFSPSYDSTTIIVAATTASSITTLLSLNTRPENS